MSNGVRLEGKRRERERENVSYMVERECSDAKAPGARLEIWLSYSDSRRTEPRPVKVALSMQLIWLLRSILE